MASTFITGARRDTPLPGLSAFKRAADGHALLSSLKLISLLAILLRHRTRVRYVAFLPVVPYLSDFAENLNHLMMLGAWPEHPGLSWAVGSWFTAG